MRYETFFFKARGNSQKCTFKAAEMPLAIVIEFADLKRAELHRQKYEDGDAETIPDFSTSAVVAITNPGRVSY